MMDTLAPERRSAIMSLVKGKDTRPELAVRRIAHSIGLRYRLHRRDLYGTPDLVFPKHKTALFVHGCFWHRHPLCSKSSTPKSNAEFWMTKFSKTVARDRQTQEELEKEGWRVCVIWECETKDPVRIENWLRKTFNLCKEEAESAL